MRNNRKVMPYCCVVRKYFKKNVVFAFHYNFRFRLKILKNIVILKLNADLSLMSIG